MADDQWPDPVVRGQRRRILSFRLACAGAIALAAIVVFRRPLASARAFLWPPTEPIGQWSFLVLMHVGGLVVVPLIVGSFVADRLYDRVVDDSVDERGP